MLGNIQILRWLAATLVVLFHASAIVTKEGGTPVWTLSFQHWGEAGVDAFFVISGFVMVLSQARHPRGIQAFLVERALRILPLYWSLTLAMGFVLAVLPQLFNTESFSAARLIASLSMVSAWAGHPFPTIYVGWTLEFEALFYVIFAVTCRLLPLHWAWAGVGLLFGLGGWIGVTPTFLVEFAYGMALCSAWTLTGSGRHPGLGLILALAAILAGAAMFQLLEPGIGRHLVWGLPAAALVAGLVLLPQASGALALRMGASSYAVYLMQVPMLPIAFRAINKTAPGLDPDLRVLSATAITLLAGLLCHLWFEAPLTRALKRRLSRPVDLGRSAR